MRMFSLSFSGRIVKEAPFPEVHESHRAGWGNERQVTTPRAGNLIVVVTSGKAATPKRN